MSKTRPTRTAVPRGDVGPAERHQHGDTAFAPRADDRGRVVQGARATATCPLDAYLLRGQIDWRQHDAGSTLHRLYRAAIASPPLVSRYKARVDGGGGANYAPTGPSRHVLRVLLEAGLAERKRSVTPLLIEGRSGQHQEPLEAGITLNGKGHIVMAVCALEEWAGGTRRLDKLREGLSALAYAMRIGERRKSV